MFKNANTSKSYGNTILFQLSLKAEKITMPELNVGDLVLELVKYNFLQQI